MNDSISTPSDEEQILADFVAALEKDGPAAIDAFAARHPLLGEEFRSLAAMGRLFHQSRADAEPAVPERLGEFRIVRRIGRGGMGEIYEAVQDRLQRRVAVKVIRQGKISPDSRARFLREQTVLARLHQTHIVPIHTAGEHGPLQYFAMPYIEGATLSETIQRAREMQASNPKAKTPPLGVIAGKLAADSRQKAQPPAPTAPALSPLSHGGSALGHRDGAEGMTDLHRASDTPPSNNTVPVTTHHSRLTTHLSMDYFRSASQVLADAAMALHHAHAVQILHRDVKPSNIMVDKSGQCWIIDFGLAGYVNQQREPNLNEETIDFEPEPITSAHIKGTPQYMAPEQFDGQSDVRTDVWGLGVTLYELCTLHRAFEGRGQHEISRKIQSEEPPPARQLVPNLPADLAAICRKAMHKDAARRYATSEAFAADLNRWLRHEPVHARPTNALRRAWLWSKRNKGWAAAVVLCLAMWITIGLGVAGFYFQKARTAEAEATASKEEAGARQREFIMQIETIRLLPHLASNEELGTGWSDRAWDLVIKAAESGPDELLRDRAAATLAGLDALCKKIFNFEAGSVAFDALGERLLIGGTHEQEAKLWDSKRDLLVHSEFKGYGPVIFGPDGKALQFRYKPGDSPVLQLCDVASSNILRELVAPKGDKRNRGEKPTFHDWALTPTLSHFAVATTIGNGSGTVYVWDEHSTKPIHEFAGSYGTLAFSPDGKRLAAGSEDGRVSVWSVSDWRELNSFALHRVSSRCLTFSPDSKRLAAGDSIGNVTIWNLAYSSSIVCRGSRYQVRAVAFSPDGTILASGGRNACKLWDTATGRHLLDLESGDFVNGLTFSSDGLKLAVSSQTAFQPGRVHLWELDCGRGIKTLRGFATPLERICFSKDGKLLAGITHDWQIGIWELPAGRLRHVLEVPEGISPDNAGLAFSPDGGQLAFSTGMNAMLWDTANGQKVDSWELPPGMVDLMTFPQKDRLLLFRVERKSRKVAPFDRNVKLQDDPQVGRIRNLVGPTREWPIAEINQFPTGITGAVVSPDGSLLFLESAGKERERKLEAFDGLTGKNLWKVPNVYAAYPEIDSAGTVLGFTGTGNRYYFLDIASQTLDAVEVHPGCMSPNSFYYCGDPPGIPAPAGLSLYQRGKREPLLTLGIDSSRFRFAQFNSAGTHLAWPNPDGTFTVCDLEAVRLRLAKVGMGWEPVTSSR